MKLKKVEVVVNIDCSVNFVEGSNTDSGYEAPTMFDSWYSVLRFERLTLTVDYMLYS